MAKINPESDLSKNGTVDQIQSAIFFNPSEERNSCLLLMNDAGNKFQNSGTKVWVSKEVLSVHSPVFKRLFYGHFVESVNGGAVKLPGKKVNEFVEFLSCLFPYPTKRKIDQSNVSLIMRLSDEYDVEYLRRKCVKFFRQKLAEMRIGDENALKYLSSFAKYRLHELLTLCIPYAAVLPFSILDDFRARSLGTTSPSTTGTDSETSLAEDELLNCHSVNDSVWAAIFEAKARRLSYESRCHNLHCIAVKAVCVYCGCNQAMNCRQCPRTVCNKCRSKPCGGFHRGECPAAAASYIESVNYHCLCGYEFFDKTISL